jgi:hypothetical protein
LPTSVPVPVTTITLTSNQTTTGLCGATRRVR